MDIQEAQAQMCRAQYFGLQPMGLWFLPPQGLHRGGLFLLEHTPLPSPGHALALLTFLKNICFFIDIF